MKPCVILWWGRYVHVRERNAMKIALYHIYCDPRLLENENLNLERRHIYSFSLIQSPGDRKLLEIQDCALFRAIQFGVSHRQYSIYIYIYER